MNYYKYYLRVLFGFLIFFETSFSQSVTNPDISVIPRFLIESHDGDKLPEKREFSRPEFTLEELEIAIQAYLNPFARADVFLTKAGLGNEPIEAEECYATFLKGLPLDLNVKFGKYKAEFGKINSIHPHALPFLTTPLVTQRFLGDEGLNDLGLSVSYVIPAGDEVYTRLTLDLLRGNSIPTAAGIPDTLGGNTYYANSGRLMSFFSLTENSDLEVGISGLTGIQDPYNKYRFFYGNLDFKYKWKPNMYTALIVQGEALLNSRKISENGSISSAGFYLYADYQFNKIYSIGLRYDWSQSPYSKNDKSKAISVFLGYYPVEETMAFRLQYQNTIKNAPIIGNRSENMIALEVMFSMGPHKAHPF